jgi:hypothetical protein
MWLGIGKAKRAEEGQEGRKDLMKDFHDLLRKKPSSLSMLLGWSSVSFTTLKIQAVYLDLMARMLVL